MAYQSPYAAPQIDFSRIGRIADSYYDAQDGRVRRDAVAENQVAQRQARQRQAEQDARAREEQEQLKSTLGDGALYDAQGNFNTQAAASRLARIGNLDAAGKVVGFEEARQKLGSTDDIKEYKFYLGEEQKAGRPPVSFNDFRLARGKAGAGAGPANVQEWEYYNKLSPEQQQQYLTMKRAEKYLDTGTEFVRPNPVAPGQNVASVPKDIRGAANAKEAGTIGEIFDPATGQKQKVLRQPDGSWAPYGGTEAPGITEIDEGTGTRIVNKATGADMRTIPKNLAEAEYQKHLGGEQGKLAAELPEKKRKVEAGMRELEHQWSVVGEDIDRAIASIDAGVLPKTGAMSLLAYAPGTPQHDLGSLLDTVKANIGFDKLQSMRENSPTGGALGQVSNFENELLQAVRGSLQQSQSADQLKQNLRRVKGILGALRQEKQAAFARDFSTAAGGAQAQPPPQAAPEADNPASMSDDDLKRILGIN